MAKYKEFWYNSWRSMMSRCYNEKAANYKYYGAVGILVCEEWHNADCFGKWAKSSGWFDGATLDRIDNSKGYSPDNCKWATKKEQAKNRCTTRLITHNGETHNITEISLQYRNQSIRIYVTHLLCSFRIDCYILMYQIFHLHSNLSIIYL